MRQQRKSVKVMKKKVLKGVAVLALVLAAAPVGYLVYGAVTYTEEPLHRLEQFAETEHYDQLVERIRERMPEDSDSFTFVAVGDTQSNYAVASRVLNRAAAEDPVFMLHAGDIVRRGRVEEFRAYHMRLVEEVAPIPVVPAPGNHERGPNYDYAAFRTIYGDERFSFDVGNSRFVGVNNTDHFRMSGSDVRFLEEELSKPGAEHKFVVFHIPPRFVEKAVEADDTRGFVWNARRFHDVMVEQEVEHVFMGHVHGFATTTIDGVRYTISGGGGGTLTTVLGPLGNVHNYVVAHVSPDGVEYEVMRILDDEWHRNPIK